MASASEEQLYRRVAALERANLLWKAATLILALAVVALLVLGGSIGAAMALQGGHRWQELMDMTEKARQEAEQARALAEQARQAEHKARQRAEVELRAAEAARLRAEEAMRAVGVPPAGAKKAP